MLGQPKEERLLLEATYDGRMTVTGSRKEDVNGETVVTPNVVRYADVPCALSFSATPSSEKDENSGMVQYQATIYCAPEYDIPPGCRLAVTQYGAAYAFKYSGERIVYPTHQQLSVIKEVRT